MDEPDKNPINPYLKRVKRRPSCLLEAIIFATLSMVTLAGVRTILGPYLDNLFDSIFGMGLK